ncbi:HAD-IC family P-type ATPase [Algoriphagus sp. NG3]|uniref:cation-translocating P-type ATPase n=1 Tax=Algoriphagus sp. NG3 TaxID=3097546 RepID=UPI002A839BB1|nr:HAD-IC family P-type ATPase [Algoriphagus sp. NG3]WPR75955.1 HAD-IC family P-type ATPase [Algoriphagus sp. NG3]
MEIDQNHPYHTFEIQDTLQEVSAEEKGLSSEEAQNRQEEFGKNVLPEKEVANPFLLFLKQFKDFLILILFVAAGIAFWAEKMADVYIILAVILFNGIVGFVQEYRAEKAIQAIKSLDQKYAFVLRDGKEEKIEAENVVPGDIIILKEGNSIPADARLIEAKELRTSEASLTGESMPVEKNTATTDEGASIGDRLNMVWKSTNIVNGKGKAVVTATGKKTEIGKIARSMGEMKMQDSNFRKKTKLLGKQMAVIAMLVSAVVFSLGYWFRDYEFEETLLVTIAVLVSIIPEGLPAVISIVLAIGASRMAKQNAIVREFTATEIMGSVSTLLTDKTGTLTQSILVIKRFFTGSGKEIAVTGNGYELEGEFKEEGNSFEWEDRPVERKLLAIAAFCNDAQIQKGHEKGEDLEIEGKEKDANKESDDPQISGDPTEVAMLVMGRKSNVKDKDPFTGYKILDDVPFKSEQKFRASLVETEEGPELFAIGAPERILELSTEYLTEEGSEELGEKMEQEIQSKMDEWADDAMRVLALGFRKWGDKERISAEDVKELCWVGMVGIVDPPREGVKESIAECKTAGIRVMMVTGDHKKTAAAIAKDVGILSGEENDDKYPAAMTTQELDVADEEFDEYINHVNVFARMNPDTKLRIAERLQAKDTLIAMTGDGVNDAPALKRADVGIAMGIRGTDVAKDASEIVLQDDNFSSIVNAIREGRIVFNNVRITSFFLLSTNFAFGIAFITSMILGWPLLLTAVQILFVNLVTAGIVDIALATEPGHGDIMKMPPIKKSESILKKDFFPFLLTVSVVIVILTLFTFNHYRSESEEMARTATFVMASMSQIFNVFNMRSLRLSIFEIRPFSNRWVTLAFLAAIVLQVLVIKIPFFRDLMEFEDFPILDFLVITLISIVIIGAGELYKYLKFQRKMF